MYDWANSAYQCTVITAVFPVYFAKTVAAGTLAPAEATERLATATTIALTIVALLGPVLGAIADFAAQKKRMLAFSVAIGAASTAALYWTGAGGWTFALAMFIVGNIAIAISFIFYDSLLPHIASEDEMDRVSSAGYAIGYLGGGVLLALNLAWILKPAAFGLPDAGIAARLSFMSVAVWWLVFSLPLFFRVPEPVRVIESDETPKEGAVRAAVLRLRETFAEMRGYRQAFLLLLAVVVYNDGIGTIQRMAGVYGAEIGIGETDLIAAFVMVQFVGVPFAFAFGMIADRIGAKNAIMLSLVMYVFISIFGYFMKTATHFFVLAFLVAMVQGGSQALGRSLFASMIPRHKSAEFFGFFSVFERFAGLLGPAAFALTIRLTGSGRYAIVSVIVFFVVGAMLLWRVDVKEGQRVAAADPAPLS